MTTSLSAVLDNNIISGEFDFDNQNEFTLPAIEIRLVHRHFKSNGVICETVLKTIQVNQNAFQTKSINTANSFSFNFKFFNPLYVSGLHVISTETRNSNSVTTETIVVVGDALPQISNPIKNPTFDENVPPSLPVDNTVTIEEPINNIIYNKPLQADRTSSRVVLLDNNSFKIFEQNSQQPSIVENSITNLLPDPYFQTSNQYNIDAPGYIVSESIKTLTQNLNYWDINLRNSNFLNAFSPVIRPNELIGLPQGIPYITFSAHFKFIFEETCPCDKVRLYLNFYNSNRVLIKSTNKDYGISNQLWKQFYISSKTIPPSAKFFDFAIELLDISSTNPFFMGCTGLQAEVNATPTSGVFNIRIQDLYKTASDITFSLPLYIKLQTAHYAEGGVRGLIDTTQNGKNGFQWIVNNNKYVYKEYDVAGAVINNVVSNTFSAIDEDVITYSVYITTSNIIFSVNEAVISSHSGTFSGGQVIKPIVGSLFTTGSSINSTILNFGIFKENV